MSNAAAVFLRPSLAGVGALLCFAVHAGPPSAAGWIADPNGCKVANPHPQSIESIRWSGQCNDGFAEGPGTVSWYMSGKPNGITSGTFKQGKLTGQGFVTLPRTLYAWRSDKGPVPLKRSWPSGSRLDGKFADNRLVGDGTVTTPGGEKVPVREVDGLLVRR